MAGLGRKVFEALDVLTAADVNGYLMDQSVMTFADESARSSAIGTPAAGMVSYLVDPGVLQLYGTAWANVSNIGDITEVVAGVGLTGGGDSGSVTLNVQTTLTSSTATSYTIQSSDQGTFLRFTNPGTVTVSTATAFTPGQEVQIFNDGTALAVVPGADVTIYGRGTAQGTAGFLAESQYDAFALVCVATNSYRIIGNVTAV